MPLVRRMGEMNTGNVGANAGGVRGASSMQGESGSVGAMWGEMPGIANAAFSEASSKAELGNNINNESNMSISGNQGNIQVSNQTNISQEIEINIMNEYHSSGLGNKKLDKLFEELISQGTDMETLKKILEVIQQKQLEELIKLLMIILQGSGSGSIVNAQG